MTDNDKAREIASELTDGWDFGQRLGIAIDYGVECFIAGKESQQSALADKDKEIARLREALTEIAKRGANPITQYGYGKELAWSRLADDVWRIANQALATKEADK